MPPPPANANEGFDLGLVLAGAISAGAYSSGVLDFLLEAMDAWEAARSDPAQAAPAHRLTLRVAAGASAGGMCAAQLASLCNRECPPMRAPQEATRSANVLFESWVNRIDISRLLGTDDGGAGVIESLLDSTVIDEIATEAFSPETPACARPYIAPDFTVYTAVTNLRGVPYLIQFEADAAASVIEGQDLARHQHAWRFALAPGGLATDGSVGLDPARRDTPGWLALRQAAVASGAFPIGLRPRRLVQSKTELGAFSYGGFTPRPDGAWDPTIMSIGANWPREIADLPGKAPLAYWAVDGGVVDNEPLELVRLRLSGDKLVNPREPDAVQGITLLIDPFVGWGAREFSDTTVDQDGNPIPLPILSNALALMGAWKNQARFKPDELRLAQDETCFSRFLIAPVREAGGETLLSPLAIACGCLGGFGGFLDRDFRVHDYVLGRRNCQQFLRRHFALPVSDTGINPRFGTTLAAARAAGWEARGWIFQEDGQWFMPLVPLVGTAAQRIDPPVWPRYGTSRLEVLRKQIGQRLDHVAGVSLDAMKPWWARWLAKAAWQGMSSKAVDWAAGQARTQIEQHGLWSDQPPSAV